MPARLNENSILGRLTDSGIIYTPALVPTHFPAMACVLDKCDPEGSAAPCSPCTIPQGTCDNHHNFALNLIDSSSSTIGCAFPRTFSTLCQRNEITP